MATSLEDSDIDLKRHPRAKGLSALLVLAVVYTLSLIHI